MRSLPRRRLVTASLAVGLALSLVACAGSDPEPTAQPSKSDPAPVFASDEEAFAAGEAAFERFIETMRAVSDSGGSDRSGLEDVATGSALKDALEAADGYASSGWHTSGESVVEVHDRVRYVEAPGRGAVVEMYFCEDISGVDVLDSSGKSVVGDGETLIPRQLVIEGTSPQGMKVSEWSARGTFCQQ